MSEPRLLRRLRPRKNELEKLSDSTYYIHDNAFNMDENSGCSVTKQSEPNLSDAWLHSYWCHVDCRMPSGDALAICYITVAQAEDSNANVVSTPSEKCFPDLHYEILYESESAKKKLGMYARVNGLIKQPMKEAKITKSGCCS